MAAPIHCHAPFTHDLKIRSVALTGRALHESQNRTSSSVVQKLFNIAGSLARCLTTCPTRYQHITDVSTQNHSQAFVGSARDVYFAGSKHPQEASEQEASACRNALFLTDPYVDRESLISAKGTRVAGTCEWITHNESYRAWLHGDSDGDTRLLWISGSPGKGKTMMSIFLTGELEKHTASTDNAELLFFFCSAQEEKRNTVVAVLRGLVHQIATTFRLAIVSREFHGLHQCARLKLDPDNNEKVTSDIERFVANKVGELSTIQGFNDDFRASVQTALLERAEGTSM